MDDLLRDFLTESAENLAKLDQDIVELEQRPNELPLLNSVFRTIHTITGTCGFLGLARLEGVAHAAESVLVLLRDGKLHASQQVISAVLSAVDVIKGILEQLERTEQEPEGDDREVIDRLAAIVGADTAEDVSLEDLTLQFSKAVATAPSVPLATAPVTEPLASPTLPSAPTAATVPEATAPANAEGSNDGKPTLADSNLRVNVTLLDKLMNLVGELVLARNQLIQIVAGEEDSRYAAPVQHLNRVATDLQEAVMKTRMQPIGSAWTKLPRLVRDLSTANGKKIALEMIGAETELDRQILQAIQDPLTHMIRNWTPGPGLLLLSARERRRNFRDLSKRSAPGHGLPGSRLS